MFSPALISNCTSVSEVSNPTPSRLLNKPMKILVAIANYGTKNDSYLARLLTEYRSMAHEVDFVLLSNIAKNLGPDVEVRVGLPSEDPWSLPFGHQQIFAERLSKYDLFIYSEDDTLVTERNVRAFVEASSALPENEIPGFLRYEQGPDGQINYCDVHGGYHWDSQFVGSRGKYTVAFFTNEHAACYLLTRQQLQRAVESGGYLVGPHKGKYDLLCTAATDPYTQCGFKKVICISDLDDFLLHHLPNRYIGNLGAEGAVVRRQVDVLLKMARNGGGRATLFSTETKLKDGRYSKDYYEPIRPDVVSAIPISTRSILSIGCGSGATETTLAKKGLRVVAVPIDPVIAAGLENEGVELAKGDLKTVRGQLAGEKFDCLLISNVLHLVDDPVRWLTSFKDLLSAGATVIAVVPNLSKLPVIWGRVRGEGRFKDLGSFERSGVHVTSHGIVERWFKRAGIVVEKTIDVLSSSQARKVSRLSLGLVDSLLGSELIVVAKTVASH